MERKPKYNVSTIQGDLYETIDNLINYSEDLSWTGLREITYQSIGSEIRKGKKDIQLTTLVKIVNYLETDFNTLLGEGVE